jgi:hypothetical protein
VGSNLSVGQAVAWFGLVWFGYWWGITLADDWIDIVYAITDC